MAKVLYPGSFDPLTKGHMNIIEQAYKLFNDILIVVMANPYKKNSFFTLEERVEIIKKIYENRPGIQVITASGATVDVARLYKCQAIIRGLRSLTDFDYEIQMQQINKEISAGLVNTICFFADKEYQFISSSMVKEVFNLNKDISNYVADEVYKRMLIKKEDLK